MKHALLVSVVATTFLLAGGSAHSQHCEPVWDPVFASGEVPANTTAAILFDGPQGRWIVAGGTFVQAGGLPAKGIARWDGVSWGAIGEGLEPWGGPGGVLALCAFDPDAAGPQPVTLFAGGRFFFSGGVVTSLAMWSGSQWLPVPGAPDDLVFALASFDEDGAGPNAPALFVGGSFDTVGGGPAANLARWDGSSWSNMNGGASGTVNVARALDPDGTGPAGEVLIVGGYFDSVGGVNAPRIAAWSGSQWSDFGDGLDDPDNAVRCLAAHEVNGQRRLIAGGAIPQLAGQPAGNVVWWSGSSWQALGEVQEPVNALAEFDPDGPGPVPAVLVASGGLTEASGVPVNGITQWNGAAWTPLAEGLRSHDVPTPNPALGGPMVACDDDGAGPRPESLHVFGSFNMAGSGGGRGYARWDGEQWYAPGGGLAGPGVGNGASAMILFDEDGQGPADAVLIVAGAFTNAGTSRVRNIARWNGDSWTDVGGGIDKHVWALEQFDEDGPGPQEPALFAGGFFTEAGGVAAGRIARWNGQEWSRLAADIGVLGSQVNALAVYDHDGSGGQNASLYVSGSFPGAGSLSAPGILRWNGQTWSGVGTGIAGESGGRMTVFDEDGPGTQPASLYMGGRFTAVGGVPALNIARWDGFAWYPLGAGLTHNSGGVVAALCVFDLDGGGPQPARLLAGGDFVWSGSVWSPYVSQWDGAAWSPVGEGFNAAVSGLASVALHPGGMPALVAAGRFTHSGQTGGVGGLARWDGGAWTSLEGGVGGQQFAAAGSILAHDDGSGFAVYVGGGFQQAGGVSAAHIARRRCQPPPCYPDCNNDGVLNLGDFGCFQTAFATGNMYADCNVDGLLNLADFGCFQTKFALGCP